MTLEEAIAHHEWGMNNCEGEEQRDQRRYHQWLTELKAARECAFGDISMAARATRELREVKAENVKLRKYAMLLVSAISNDGCGCCPYDLKPDVCDTGILPMRNGCMLYEEMCKLGIDVSE